MREATEFEVGVLGAGTMGRGIAQVAATFGHNVTIHDADYGALMRTQESLEKTHARLVEKGRIDRSEADSILSRLHYVDDMEDLSGCAIVIEAIIEYLEDKQSAFSDLDGLVSEDAILGTNTSSLSITSIASACSHPERVVGTHFFNPAPLMTLVEIVPGLATSDTSVNDARDLIESWGKTTVQVRDTPGFIVNRVARPFYGEALRILDEGIADVATIDWALRELGGFRMGPFELMDLIGNDVNLTVTESVFEAFYFDPRFKPSFTQQRLVEAGRLGRKSGRGYYNYGPGASKPEPRRDLELGETILDRVVAMLINEAADAVFMRIASARDVDTAMTKGVNYPKGLLAWAEEIGLETVLARLETLQNEYREDRYRPNPLLRRLAGNGGSFLSA